MCLSELIVLVGPVPGLSPLQLLLGYLLAIQKQQGRHLHRHKHPVVCILGFGAPVEITGSRLVVHHGQPQQNKHWSHWMWTIWLHLPQKLREKRPDVVDESGQIWNVIFVDWQVFEAVVLHTSEHRVQLVLVHYQSLHTRETTENIL